MPPSTIQRTAVLAACADMIRACGLTLAELADELAKPQQAVRMLTLPVIDQGELNAPAAPKLPQRSGPALSQQAQQVLAYADRPEGATTGDITDMLGVHYATGAYHCERLVRARLLTKVKVRGEHAMRYWSNPAHALAYVEARAVDAEQLRVEEGQAAEQRRLEAEERQRLADERAAEVVRRRQQNEAAAAFPALAPATAPAVAALSPAELRSIQIHAAKVAGSKKAPAPMGARTPHKPKPLPHQTLVITPPKIDDTRMRPAGEPIKTAKTIETLDTKVRPTAKWQMQDLPPDPRYPSFSSMRPGVNPDTGKAWEGRA